MRAQRRSMQGPAGVARLAVENDDSKTKIAIDAKHVTKRFGEREILKDLSLRVQRGDRIGIVGANGTGKTTLLKLLLGEIEPDEGSIRRAKTLDVVLIDQQRKLLQPGKTVRDILADGGDWVEVRGVKKHIQGYLKDFLFAPGLAEEIGRASRRDRVCQYV